MPVDKLTLEYLVPFPYIDQTETHRPIESVSSATVGLMGRLVSTSSRMAPERLSLTLGCRFGIQKHGHRFFISAYDYLALNGDP